MSIVQLSRFFVCVVLFKRQLLYFIKSFCLCQELFYFSLSLFSSFPLPSHATAYLGYHFQNSLSTTFLIYFSIISLIFKSSSFLPIKNVPPPRLLLSSVPLLFSLLFLSDEGYLITAVFNCQCFLYISCNSDYSDNSFFFDAVSNRMSVRQICYYSPPEEVEVFSTEINPLVYIGR